jgi:hypothetical protein
VISEAELTGIWADLATSYRDEAEVRRPLPPERRRDRGGGSTAPALDPVGTVRGRLSRGFVPGREQQIGGGLTNVTSAIFACAPAADIRASDQLVITHLDYPEWPPITLDVVSAEVRRTIALEQVITANVIGGEPPLPIVPLST